MRTLLLAAAIFVGGLGVSAQQHNIDTQKSTLTIHVGKAGAFSALGHEHEVHAAIHSGVADTGSHPTVEVHVQWHSSWRRLIRFSRCWTHSFSGTSLIPMQLATGSIQARSLSAE